jgi:hypothetical protein
MDDVTALMDGYRECVRHVWNTHFQRDAERDTDWDLRDEFNAVAATLFRALVLRKLGRRESVVQPDQISPRQPLSFLRVEVEPSSSIMVNRVADGGYWDHPLTFVAKGDLDLRFLRYFDWSDLAFRDFAFYRVRVIGSLKHPEVVGKDALLPVGTNVRLVSEGRSD